MDHSVVPADNWQSRIHQRFIAATARIRAGARVIGTVVSICLLAGSIIVASLVARPAIQRWSDLLNYLRSPQGVVFPDAERLSARLRTIVGDERASKLSIRILGDLTAFDLLDSEQAAVRIDELGNTPPGGDIYWLPRAGAVCDSYGLLMATLIDADKDRLRLDRSIQHAVETYLSLSSRKQFGEDSGIPARMMSLPRARTRTPPADPVLDEGIKAAAAVLRERLKGTASNDAVLRDFRQYVGLADAELQPSTRLRGLNEWLEGPLGPMEEVASGDLQIVTFSASGEQKTQPTVVKATVYGKQAQLLNLERPGWFRFATIETARMRAGSSNTFARFFGTNGVLSAIPVMVFVVKEPQYVIQVAPPDMSRIAEVLDDPSATVVVQYAGGKIIVPGSSALRLSHGVYWRLKPAQPQARAVAVVSQLF